jgi:hypothetical protein
VQSANHRQPPLTFPAAAASPSSGSAPAQLRLSSGSAPAQLRLSSGTAPVQLRLSSGVRARFFNFCFYFVFLLSGDTLYYVYSPIATLRSAISWKYLTQKNLTKKKIQTRKFFVYFFSNFFWLSVFRSQFGVCLQKFGGSKPTGLGLRRR